MKTACRSIVLALGAFMPIELFADEVRGCATPMRITGKLIADIQESNLFALETQTRTIIVGWRSPLHSDATGDASAGSILLLRDGPGDWRAVAPRPGEGLVALFQDPASGEFVAATMWRTEGPGDSWTLVRSRDDFATANCQTIKFPGSLNQPFWANEYLDLMDFNIDADGVGAIIGRALWEDPKQRWYSYETTNDGADWHDPIELTSPPNARAGRFRRVLDAPPPAALLQELRSAVK